jgi:hypothetical protein
MSFAAYCERLGTPLKNKRWSWAALSADGKRAVFTIWGDELKNRQYVLHPTRLRRPRPAGTEYLADERPGAVELKRVAETALSSGAECLGILCQAKDPAADTREREGFDHRTVFRLVLERRAGGEIVARVTARVPADDVMP